MEGSPIAEDYDQYRLLDGQEIVIFIEKYSHRESEIKTLDGQYGKVEDGRLSDPQVSQLREAGIEPPEVDSVSTPEPPPERGDRDVPEPLIAFLEDQGYDDAADLVRKRVRFGEQKYGTRLETDNGRDPIEDAKQEIGDALQYLAQAKMEGRNVRELNDLILGALLAVLGEYSG